MDYLEEEKRERRIELAALLEAENPPQEVTHCLYVLGGLKEENEKLCLLDDNDIDNITKELFKLTYYVRDEFDGFGREGIVGNKSFDLYLFSSSLTSQIVEEGIDKEKSDRLFDIYLTIISALFCLWMEDISTDEVIRYYRGETDRVLPTLRDRFPNYKWVQDKGVFCNDMVGLLNASQYMEMSADDEIGALNALGDMCKIFDTLRPEIVSMMNLEDSFIEENLLDCRNIFMTTLVMYAALPAVLDTKGVCGDSERLEQMFDTFVNHFAGEELKATLLDETKRDGYIKVFAFSFQTAEVMEDSGNGFFKHTRNDLYKEMTARRAKEQ